MEPFPLLPTYFLIGLVNIGIGYYLGRRSLLNKHDCDGKGHTFSKWEVYKNDTSIKDGIQYFQFEKKRNCRACGEFERKRIPKAEV
ncbi:hypothetical protein N9948_01800 [bacterium]|nr:hypothetical protein [bacterium]